MGNLTRNKVKTMLKENKAKGKKLTKAQKGLFGLIAGGKKPLKKRKKHG